MRFKLSIACIIVTLCLIATQSTSNYIEEVSWNETRKQWQFNFCFTDGMKKKFYFDNEFDAAKKLNQLYEKIEISSLNEIQNQQATKIINKPNALHVNFGISGIQNQKLKEAKEKTSQYAGVYLQKQTGKWYALIYTKEDKKQKYGGYFSNELDAAKKVNQICEELGIPPKNPEISVMPINQERNEKQSQYKGVSWHKASRKWRVQFKLKGQKQKHGRLFTDETDAAKKVNQICEEWGIPPKNPGISGMPNQEIKEKTSQYAGVYLQKQTGKWHAVVNIKKEKKQKYGGGFSNELDAAKKVNQMCEELGMPPKNPEISGMPIQQLKKIKEKTSDQYAGVYFQKQTGKWFVLIYIKDEKKQKYGGCFDNELDAAKKVNQICEELGIPPQNPGITLMLNNQDDNNQIIDPENANPAIDSDNTSDDEDNCGNENKRKRKKDSLLDDKSSAEQYYFYDHMLKEMNPKYTQ